MRTLPEQRFESLVRQAFCHVDFLDVHVKQGEYDILSPNQHLILPAVWEDVIEPGWEISMHMWPLPEPRVERVEIVDSVPDVRAPPPMRREHAPHRLDDICEEGMWCTFLLWCLLLQGRDWVG